MKRFPSRCIPAIRDIGYTGDPKFMKTCASAIVYYIKWIGMKLLVFIQDTRPTGILCIPVCRYGPEVRYFENVMKLE